MNYIKTGMLLEKIKIMVLQDRKMIITEITERPREIMDALHVCLNIEEIRLITLDLAALLTQRVGTTAIFIQIFGHFASK